MGKLYDIIREVAAEEWRHEYVEDIKTLFLELIGEDREYNKYADCPHGTGLQYSCHCVTAETAVKSKLRKKVEEL